MRFLAFAVLAVAAVSGNEIKRICEPGTLTKNGCNDCLCSADGTFQSCTMMACMSDTRLRRETIEKAGVVVEGPKRKNSGIVSNNPLLLRLRRQVSHNRPCEAGKQFKIYCNTCSCGSDGYSVACTRMECPKGVYNEDGSLKNVEAAPNNALLRLKRQLSQNITCEPGKTFKSYCNTCSCGLDGVSIACTLMACDETVYNPDGSLKSPGELSDTALLRQKRQVSHDRPCEAGKQFKVYCNTCACGSDGFSVVCTRMACPKGVYNEDGSLKNVQEAPSDALPRQKRQVSHNRPCEAGKQFKIYCNTCSCGSDGFSVACTRMECPKGVYNEDGSLKNVEAAPNKALLRLKRQLSQNTTCEPGKTFKSYCNTCRCGLDGVSIACTLMACDETVYNQDGSLKNPGELSDTALLRQKRQVSHNRPCEAGKQFKIYCNTCACGSDGFSVVCTRMECPKDVYNEDGSLKNLGEVSNNGLLRQKRQLSRGTTCEPGKAVKYYCNTCTCGNDGVTLSCAIMPCPPGVHNRDGTLKNLGEVPNNTLLRQKRQLSQGTTCEPGKTFKNYCNTCTCGNDGVTMACTIMACPEGLYNQDGTLKSLGEVPNNGLLRQKRQASEEQSCKPGESFKVGCNTCGCDDDGRTLHCTQLGCPEDYTEEDNSRD